MHGNMAVAGLVGVVALVAGGPAVAESAQAATGYCEESFGHRISTPARDRASGSNTVVMGLTGATRTVTFYVNEGCELEVGDRWSAVSAYFAARGTYDGTAASLTDPVQVDRPRSDSEVGFHAVTVTLDDVTGSDNDTVVETGFYLKRRTQWRRFNVFPESPTPACGVMTGTVLRARGRVMRASWTSNAYRPYPDRRVRLLTSAAHTVEHDVASTIARDRTGSRGWAHFTFRPPYDANYLAHYAGNRRAGHADSGRDYVNCQR